MFLGRYLSTYLPRTILIHLNTEVPTYFNAFQSDLSTRSLHLTTSKKIYCYIKSHF